MARKAGVNTQRIQAVLNTQYIKESHALDVFNDCLDKRNWDARTTLTEALILLGKSLDENWQPDIMPDTINVPSKILLLMEELANAVHTMKNMQNFIRDMPVSIREHQEWDDKAFVNLKNQLEETATKLGGTTMFGEGKTFDDDEAF